MRKQLILAGLTLGFGMFMVPSVHAADPCTPADGEALSTQLSSCSDIALQSGQTYTGQFTIGKDITIVGNGATINGTFTITGADSANVNISNLTMTGTNGKEEGTNAQPEYIAVKTPNVKLNVSNVNIYYGNMNESNQFTAHGTGIVVYAEDSAGSTVEVTDSTIHAKYAIWIEGSNSDLTVRNSQLSGYAALDLTSSSQKTSGNNITIDNSTLTGYALGKAAQNNDFGTIAIANKNNVQINIINNSVITNNFANGIDARSDLILISDNPALPTNVNVNVSNSTLDNTNNEFGAVYNANGTNDNSFKTENTTIMGTLIAGAEGQYYVDFVVDGKSNVVLVGADGKLNPSDIPNVSKEDADACWLYLRRMV